MESVSKDQFRKNIVAFFQKETGLTLASAKAKIKTTLKIDRWGNTENNRIKAGNVTLFYTNNPNYCGGLKNGFGKGWYIGNCGFTGGSIIKLSNKL